MPSRFAQMARTFEPTGGELIRGFRLEAHAADLAVDARQLRHLEGGAVGVVRELLHVGSSLRC